MTSTESTEPKPSDGSSTNCDHSTCGWKPRYYGPDGECLHPNKQYTGSLYDGPGGRKTWLYYSCPDCKSSWKDKEPERRGSCPPACAEAHTYSGSCLLRAFGPKGQPEPSEALDGLCRCGHPRKRHLEPPGAQCVACPGDDGRSWRHEFTPEEEGGMGDCTCSSRTIDDRGEVIHADDCPSTPEPEPWPCGDCGTINPPEAEFCSCAEEPPPPQPERRPPIAYSYSVQGHLYEVALPGDATVVAQDGALIITHSLGPVAGIVQARPLEGEQN